MIVRYLTPYCTSIIVFSILLAANAVSAALPLCAPGRPEIIVQPTSSVTELDNRHDLRDMQTLAGMGKAAHSMRAPIALGLTLTEVIATSRVMTETSTTPSGNGCAVVTRLEVTFGFTPHKIYIPRHFTPMSCPYNIIYAHEMRHVDTDRALLDSQLPQVRATIIKAMPDLAVVRGNSEAEMTGILHQRINNLLRSLQSDFIRQRHQRQALVDSQEEYARIGASCSGQLQQRP